MYCYKILTFIRCLPPDKVFHIGTHKDLKKKHCHKICCHQLQYTCICIHAFTFWHTHSFVLEKICWRMNFFHSLYISVFSATFKTSNKYIVNINGLGLWKRHMFFFNSNELLYHSYFNGTNQLWYYIQILH